MEAFGNLLILRAGMINFRHAARQVFLLTLHLVHLLKTDRHSANTVRPEEKGRPEAGSRSGCLAAA